MNSFGPIKSQTGRLIVLNDRAGNGQRPSFVILAGSADSRAAPGSRSDVFSSSLQPAVFNKGCSSLTCFHMFTPSCCSILLSFVHVRLASSAGITQVLASLSAPHLVKVSQHSGRPGVTAAFHCNSQQPPEWKNTTKRRFFFSNPEMKKKGQTKLPAPLKQPFPVADNWCRLEGVGLLVKGHLIHNLVKSSHSLLGRRLASASNLARTAQPWHLGSIRLIRNSSCRS